MDLHYSKEYLDFEKEVKAFCKKYDGVTFTDASKNPLASSSSKKKKIQGHFEIFKFKLETSPRSNSHRLSLPSPSPIMLNARSTLRSTPKEARRVNASEHIPGYKPSSSIPLPSFSSLLS